MAIGSSQRNPRPVPDRSGGSSVPLIALDGRRSPHVERCVAALTAAGCHVSIEPVPYGFQRGANEMLRIRADEGSTAPEPE